MIAPCFLGRHAGDIRLNDLAHFFFDGHACDDRIDARFDRGVLGIGPVRARPDFRMDGGRQIFLRCSDIFAR